MNDPIDPIRAKTSAAQVAEVPAVEPVHLNIARHDAQQGRVPAASAAQAATHTENAAREATPRPGFEVHLDGATLRVYSELRDPDTHRVLVRIPSGYKPKVEPPQNYSPTELKT